MIDKKLIVGGAHFAVLAVLLKLLGLILPCCITCYYSSIANFLLYLYLARFTFEFTRQWYLQERVQPENRAVFITGCDTGFGHGLAKRLDSLGYPVFAGCLDENSNGAKELKKSCSKRLQIVEIDVTKDTSVENSVVFVKENLGTSELWAIVNNAGILKGFEVELTDMQFFKDTLEVNTLGPVRVTRAFLPLLRQSRGRIVNMNSMAGRLPLPYYTAYAMSKHASVAFTECLSQEMMYWGIRVISIEPECFRTEMASAEDIKSKFDEAVSKLNPDVKEDYGEKYFKKFKNFIELTTGGCTGDPEIVVDALEDAISLQYPSSLYKPCRNFVAQVLFYMSERIPSGMVHAILRVFYIAIGFPKPREAENYL